jgi:hypothetical protein
MTANDWYIKNLPATNEARRKITAYASLKNITIPQAIAEIVKLAKI